MKMLLGLATIALSFSSLATTTDTKTFVYDGSVNSVELQLRSEKTHTEFHYEQQPSTCFRQEIAGYRTVCTGSQAVVNDGPYRPYPGPGPHPGPFPPPYPGPGPRPYPGPGPIRHCWSEPIYRSVAYSCMQTVRVGTEVSDYFVEARAIIDVTKVSPEATPGETFKAILYGDDLKFEATGSKKFFIVKKKQDIRPTMNGSVKMIDGLLAVELVEAAPILKAIKMTDIALDNNGVLNFNIGPVSSMDNLGFALKVVKTKLLGKDTVLLDRELLKTEVNVTAASEGTSAAGVNVNKLGVELTDGKFELTAKAFAKFGGELMNTKQYDELSASRTLIYKIR